MGLVLGFGPVAIGNDYSGDGFDCGSAFIVNNEGLTDLGHETCEINGGGAGRRLTALALLGAGVVLFAGGFWVAAGRIDPPQPVAEPEVN